MSTVLLTHPTRAAIPDHPPEINPTAFVVRVLIMLNYEYVQQIVGAALASNHIEQHKSSLVPQWWGLVLVDAMDGARCGRAAVPTQFGLLAVPRMLQLCTSSSLISSLFVASPRFQVILTHIMRRLSPRYPP